MWPFKCQHPISQLFVERAETKRADLHEDGDFCITHYHLWCRACGTHGLGIKYAEPLPPRQTQEKAK